MVLLEESKGAITIVLAPTSASVKPLAAGARMHEQACRHVCVLACKNLCPVFKVGGKHHVLGTASMLAFCFL